MKKYKENQENKDAQFNELVSEKMAIKQPIDNSDPWLDKIEETAPKEGGEEPEPLTPRSSGEESEEPKPPSENDNNDNTI